jgi:hypothetical protein
MNISIFRRVWGKPLIISFLTVWGLLTALLETGIWHLFSWIALSVPIAVVIVYVSKYFKADHRLT